MRIRKFRQPIFYLGGPPNPASPLKRRRFSALLVLVICLALCVFFLLWADVKIRPFAAKLALARVHSLATGEITDAITELIGQEDVQYDDLVLFEKDQSGKIIALKTDMNKINRLKAMITRRVLDKVEHLPTEELSIPLGNVVNGELLSGRGPSIPVRVVPVGTVGAEFTNSFVSAGINQTRHQILLDVVVTVGVLLPSVEEETTVTVQINLAETILIGLVPDSYANFENGLFPRGG